MKRHLGYLGAALVLMSGVPPAAQSGGSPPRQQTPPTSTAPQSPSRQASDADTQTLTGCVRSLRADTGAADLKGNVYTLEVMDTPSAGATEVGAPAPGTSGPITYALSAPDTVGLGKHVGHQVQLTGKLKPPATTHPPADEPATSTAPGAKPGHMHRTFEVSALKMISATCP